MGTQIALRIHSVKCVDETGGGLAERVGNDEIFLGGFGIDANGQTVKVGQFEVYAHFDDGDVKKFAPPHRFVALSLKQVGGGSVTAGLLLVEKDGSGMGTGLENVYAKVVEEMNKRKQEEATRRGVASLNGADVDWKAVWELVKPDDPLPLQSVSAVVGTDGTFGGNQISPRATVEFRGHDSIYSMTYDWEVS